MGHLQERERERFERREKELKVSDTEEAVLIHASISNPFLITMAHYTGTLHYIAKRKRRSRVPCLYPFSGCVAKWRGGGGG